MKAQETLLDVTANNLANVNTNGFKRSHVDFADLLYTTIRQPGAEQTVGQPSPVGLQIGSGSRPVSTTKLFTQGTPEQTGNATDIAIEGSGFFKLTLPNGDFRYTRDGAFHTNQNGLLVNADGIAVDGNITVPNDVDINQINVGMDGTVTAPQGNGTINLGTIQLYRFANPEGLNSEGGNLYSATTASGPEIAGIPGNDGLGTLRQRFLESSNVEVVTELVGLITAQRAYEVNARAVRAGDEMLANTTQILR